MSSRPRRSHRLAEASTVVATTLLLHAALLSTHGAGPSELYDFYLRTAGYAKELATGHWPTLLTEAVRGGGYLFPVMYPPVAHLVAAAWTICTGDAVLGSHFSALMAALLSGFVMLRVVQRITGSHLAGTVSAVAYLALPYRMIQLYGRGAVAESWLFVWAPLLLLATYRLATSGRCPRWAALPVAGMILSHVALGLWVAPGVMLVGLVAWHRHIHPRAWLALGTVCLLGIGVAAAWWVPMLASLPTLKAALPGYMHATPTMLAERGHPWTPTGWVLAFAIVIGVAGLGALRDTRSEDTPAARLLPWSAIGLALAMLLSIGGSWFWTLVPQPMRYIQFAWRLEALATFLAALTLGLLVPRLHTRASRGILEAALALLLVSAFPMGLKPWRGGSVTHAAIVPRIPGPVGDHGLTFRGDFFPRDAEVTTLGQRVERARQHLRAAGLRPHGAGDLPWTVPAAALEERDGLLLLPLTAYSVFELRDQDGRPLQGVSSAGQLALTRDDSMVTVTARRASPRGRTLGLALSCLSLVALMFPVGRTGPA